MEEVWKDIEGYEELYQISNLGRTKSLGRTIERTGPKGNKFYRTYPEKILICHKDLKGYYRTNLALNGRNTTVKIHRLVAQAFIPNPENKPQVNHINGNKKDNRVENLEWTTNNENMKHAYNTGLFDDRDMKHRKKVGQYTKEGKLIKEWNSIKEIEDVIGFFATNITACCKGKAKSLKGYIWKYIA